jgi:transposase InsO family protein
MKANRDRWPIARMARLLGVSTSGFYAWLVREPSQQASSDALLLARIRTLHASSRGTYSAPRIHAQLAREGMHVGRKRVARLMRMAGLCGASRAALATNHAATCGGTARTRPGTPALQR